MNVQTERYHQYRDDEVELLSLIGDLAAGALEKAILYDRMQRQITELSTLAEVSEAITSPLYLDEMLDLVVDVAARVMRAKAISLLLLNEQERVGQVLTGYAQSRKKRNQSNDWLRLVMRSQRVS
jgi:GAF domain-containing protein